MTQTLPSRRVAAFWIVAALMLLSSGSSALPSPLYPVYATAWHLSPLALTIVFAVYVVALLASLVVAGSLSDHIGRRPVLAAGLIGIVVSLVLFAVAGGLGLLILARIVQGLAIGFLFGASGASLLDNALPRHPAWATLLNGAIPATSLAVGALASGLLVQLAPAPRQTVYIVWAVLLVIGAALLLVVPESSERRPGALASLRPRVAVPAEARGAFRSVVGALVSCWALGGLYLSLVPLVLQSSFHLTDHVTAGAVIAVFCGVGAVAGVVLNRMEVRAELLTSLAALLLGSLVTATGVAAGSLVVLVVGTVVAGVGFGASFQAALRIALRDVEAEHRAGLVSAVYIVSYLALGIPSVIAGALAPLIGLTTAVIGYTALVAAIAAVTAVLQLRERARA
jgi:MFS family permease